MLIFLAFQMLLPPLPLHLSAHGGDESFIGLTTAIIALAAVIVRLFTGCALDRFNRRAMAIGGSVVFAFAAISYTFSLSVLWTVMSSLLPGITWGVMTVTYETIVAGLIPAGQQGSGIGTFLIFALGSMAVGPFLGASLYNTYGALALFGASFVIALLSLAVFLFGNGEKAELTNTATEPCAGQSFVTGIFEQSSLFPASLILLFMFSFGGILSFAALYGQQLGLKNGGVFLLLSNVAALIVIAQLAIYSVSLLRERRGQLHSPRKQA